ncbi:hypothetical protein [Puniceibacterium sp. IMCC21224]|uniref:hypothetical protein n=1 Tax=Puniceibacterium sp. IMCC21224 TaxID=1618204 RepID=UPI00064E0953|nr:hypothetical protein [Puniceibacterium sp. IMCC21224]KMK67063.1 hypothetical protein IMCC21224_111926 [Puniceibacterium sp. IMCC21224]
MKSVVTGLAGLSFLAACALPPQGIDKERIAVFDTAVASIGCDLVSESDYIPVELQTGLTREQVQEVAAYKLQLEEGVALSNGGFRLKTGACADVA